MSPSAVLERLRAVEWAGDSTSGAAEHGLVRLDEVEAADLIAAAMTAAVR
ncbi:hypothetical protein ACWEPM_31340 [Streptomyces sp. NPDC004244]